MSNQPSSLTLTGSIGDVEVARLKWIEETTPEERAAIAETLRKHDHTTIVGLNAFAKDLFVMMLVGEISPAVALAAKPFLDFLTANIYQLMAQSGHGDKAPMVISETILEMKRKVQMSARYSTARELPAPSIDADEIEALEMEKAEAG